MDVLVPLTVALPLGISALMLATSHWAPPRVPDVIAVLTALAVAGMGAVLAAWTLRHGPIAYWFGGWTPRPGVVLGIGFGVDAASAVIAAFLGLLFAAALFFSWGYFDGVHAHYQVLMMLFLAAMTGFCLTRDVFNLFVWFEVMSVAAFALTGYQLETPSLAGALNFTVVNSLASFMMLGGVGLLYARAGVMDFQALGQAVARSGHDPVVTAAFCLLASALMIKGAIVPFHFWLSDAHAVAPSPVSVIFSGAMVSVAMFVLAKLSLQVFAASPDVRFLLRTLLPALGAATALVGGLMAWGQRHLKRMLAFSTISHLGVMLVGLTTLSAAGTAGLVAYIVGHGLVKGALFMVVGMLLATRASLDELDLRGLGRGIWPAGVAMGAGALLLGGLPWGVLDAGSGLVEAAGKEGIGPWAVAAVLAGAALTGASVLRAAGRIFLGLGPDPGEEANAPTQEDQEKADRPLWLMMIPCVLLLGLDLAPADLARRLAAAAVPALAAPAGPLHAPAGLPPASPWLPWASMGLVALIAGAALFRERLPRALTDGADRLSRAFLGWLHRLHSGLVTDYVTWMMVGVAVFSVSLALR